MSEDRDDHLYTVGILIIAIALMMFIENKSSCSFPAVQTMLGLLSGLTVYHANFLEGKPDSLLTVMKKRIGARMTMDVCTQLPYCLLYLL